MAMLAASGRTYFWLLFSQNELLHMLVDGGVMSPSHAIEKDPKVVNKRATGRSSTVPVVVHDIWVEQPQNVALILASPVPVCVHVCHGGRVIMEVLATGFAAPYAVLRAAVGMAASSLPGPLVASAFGAEPVVELGVLLSWLSSAGGRHGGWRARECRRRIDATRSRHGQGMEELGEWPYIRATRGCYKATSAMSAYQADM